jgi:hypothetical protein
MANKRSNPSVPAGRETQFVLVDKRPPKGAFAGQFVVMKPSHKPDSFTLTELKRAVRSVVHANAKT